MYVCLRRLICFQKHNSDHFYRQFLSARRLNTSGGESQSAPLSFKKVPMVVKAFSLCCSFNYLPFRANTEARVTVLKELLQVFFRNGCFTSTINVLSTQVHKGNHEETVHLCRRADKNPLGHNPSNTLHFENHFKCWSAQVKKWTANSGPHSTFLALEKSTSCERVALSFQWHHPPTARVMSKTPLIIQKVNFCDSKEDNLILNKS